jgi:hypothetical protein
VAAVADDLPLPAPLCAYDSHTVSAAITPVVVVPRKTAAPTAVAAAPEAGEVKPGAVTRMKRPSARVSEWAAVRLVPLYRSRLLVCSHSRLVAGWGWQVCGDGGGCGGCRCCGVTWQRSVRSQGVAGGTHSHAGAAPIPAAVCEPPGLRAQPLAVSPRYASRF